MSKRKLLCLLLSLILLCSLAIPGTLAVSADAANDDAAPVEVNIVYPQPSTPDAQTTEPEETCTCGAENDVHTVGCPLYAEPEKSLYERLMATETLDEFSAIVDAATEEELSSLSCEEFDDVDAHYYYLSTGEVLDRSPIIDEVPTTVNFTNVAPLVGTGE